MALPGSDDEILLLHNPKCSKSRATLALLEERGARFSTRLYLEDPLDRAELRELARRLGRPALEFTRTLAVEVVYWPTMDPTAVQGSREHVLDAYRQVRDGLKKRIVKMLSP